MRLAGDQHDCPSPSLARRQRRRAARSPHRGRQAGSAMPTPAPQAVLDDTRAQHLPDRHRASTLDMVMPRSRIRKRCREDDAELRDAHPSAGRHTLQRAARFGVSPTTAASRASPVPIQSPTTTNRSQCRCGGPEIADDSSRPMRSTKAGKSGCEPPDRSHLWAWGTCRVTPDAVVGDQCTSAQRQILGHSTASFKAA